MSLSPVLALPKRPLNNRWSAYFSPLTRKKAQREAKYGSFSAVPNCREKSGIIIHISQERDRRMSEGFAEKLQCRGSIVRGFLMWAFPGLFYV